MISADRDCGYGLVIGRIQSGKAAHMLGLASRLLDQFQHGLDSLRFSDHVSGLIEDLRIQTLNRAMEAKDASVEFSRS